jgi:hypothetical protein
MLKEGIQSQYEGIAPQPAEDGVGRIAKRKANYAHAISEASGWGDRLDHIDLDSPREPTLVLDAELAELI